MDEPFGALDAQTRTVMQEKLVCIARFNPRTVLFITMRRTRRYMSPFASLVMTRLPGRIKAMLDVRGVRNGERWNDREHINDVMDLESFVHLRTRIWRSLREEQIGAAP